MESTLHWPQKKLYIKTFQAESRYYYRCVGSAMITVVCQMCTTPDVRKLVTQQLHEDGVAHGLHDRWSACVNCERQLGPVTHDNWCFVSFSIFHHHELGTLVWILDCCFTHHLLQTRIIHFARPSPWAQLARRRLLGFPPYLSSVHQNVAKLLVAMTTSKERNPCT